MDEAERMRERWAAAARCASSLVGLDAQEASDRAVAAGYRPQVVQPGGPPWTADLRLDRIRLVVVDGQVQRAVAG